jgi:outer membrane protein assembly factor BamB
MVPVLGLVGLVGFVILSPSARCVDWVAGPFCEIDVDGDGHPDLAMKGRRFSGEKLFALDGRSGKVRWTASELSTSSDVVFCAGRTAVLVQHADLHVELFASDGRLIGASSVADKVDSVRSGEGCVQIDLGNHTSLVMSLTSGQSGGTCPGAGPPATSDWDFAGAFARAGAGLTVGDLHVVKVPQDAKVERVVLRADRGGQVVWTRPTDIVAGGAHIAATRSGVLVVGNLPDGHLRLAWLRANDGGIGYEFPLPEPEDDVAFNKVWAIMVDSADTAYVDVNSHLFAYDAASGVRRWHTGL